MQLQHPSKINGLDDFLNVDQQSTDIGTDQTPTEISNQIVNDNLSTQKSINLLFRLLGRPSFVDRASKR